MVTTNPSSQTVNAGATVSFTAAASGTPTPTVQWQVSTNHGASFSNTSGPTSTSTTYAFTPIASQSGDLYRAAFSNAVATVYSAAATLTVNTALPSGWTDADIGGPAPAGAANLSNGVYTISGGGADIWNESDQFNFASTPLSGNGTLTAEVDSITNTNAWAKAGVMFRNDTTAGSPFVNMVATAGEGVSFQWRSTAGGSCNFAQVTGINTPVWVELVRDGDGMRFQRLLQQQRNHVDPGGRRAGHRYELHGPGRPGRHRPRQRGSIRPPSAT